MVSLAVMPFSNVFLVLAVMALLALLLASLFDLIFGRIEKTQSAKIKVSEIMQLLEPRYRSTPAEKEYAATELKGSIFITVPVQCFWLMKYNGTYALDNGKVVISVTQNSIPVEEALELLRML